VQDEKLSADTLNSHITQFVNKHCFDYPRNKKPKRNHMSNYVTNFGVNNY